MKGNLNIKMKLIQQGAEAKILLDEKNNLILKDRISKSYRHPELDKQIRKQRTKAEAKLLIKANKIINTPLPTAEPSIEKSFSAITDSQRRNLAKPVSKQSIPRHEVSANYTIKMPYISGKKLSEHLDKLPLKEQKQIMKLIGQSIAKIHKADIIHGDLTTSNMILVCEKTNFENQLEEVKKLNLPIGSYALFGSAPLGVRCIRKCRDIDILVNEKLWQKYKNKSDWKYELTKNGIEHLSKGIIELWNNWLPWYPNANKFIKDAEIINGIPFVKLKYFIEWKIKFGREKDKQDIKLVEKYLSTSKKSDEQSEEHSSSGGRAGKLSTPKVFFIDFGLGYISKKIEDKAVDLHLLKQALEAKHFRHFKELQDEVFKSYKKENLEAKKIFERITAVERRGRYRH